jgi:hypothetical protein
MDEMSDDDDLYGDTDANNVPDGDAGQDAAPGNLPGYPVGGHPDWRAGVSGPGRGLLGMARASDLVAQRSREDQASFAGQSDPRLMRVSDPVMDWERNSWRWNDPTAIAYDLDRKQRQRAQAQTMANGVEAFGAASEFLPIPKGAGLATAAVGAYMGHVEAERIQKEIEALKARQDQLTADPHPEFELRPRLS